MNISSVQAAHQLLTEQVQNQQNIMTKNNEGNKTDKTSFSNVFVQALNKTNELQYVADTETEKFIIGESEDIHSVMIAMEEAKIALEFTMQIRNKVMDAYTEIKNMQI